VTALTPLALPASDATPEEALAWMDRRATDGLAEVREQVDRLRGGAVTDPLAALRTWDGAMLRLVDVMAAAELFANVHPDEGVRTRAEKAGQEADTLSTDLRQDRELYDALDALDPAGLDATAARLLEKTLLDFRRSGVDRDDATRTRVKEISERLTELDQTLSRNTRDDVRTIRVEPARLKGLPQDWLDSHPVDDDGLVTVTTDYPDSVPVRTFAEDAGVRADMHLAFNNRGWPQNDEVLKEIFALRHELATLLGYADWATYDAEVKMIGTGDAIPEFIDRITEAATDPMERDLELLLTRYRQDFPDAERIASPDAAHYQEQVRKETYDVDAQQVRTYFTFDRVRRGLLDVTGRLLGLRYDEVPDAAVWHEDVTAYDVVDVRAGEDAWPFARIYLDLHPRPGKYNHAAQFTLVDGVAGRQLPEGVLVCNFSRGLMEHDEVVTLFHEFGHLVHHVLAGRGEWARFAGVATEWDFVEAPSQMLEEWAWDAAILRSFATDADGEPIPTALVDRMREADDYGKGIYARVQMFYAAVSYWFHTERPADLTEKLKELQARYSPFPYVEDTHFFTGFGHLGGYSSGYYTYMWSLVIAKDMFSAFDPTDLFAPEVAGRYRDRVLTPGGAKDAADLVADFLGRPYSFDSYAAWLAR